MTTTGTMVRRAARPGGLLVGLLGLALVLSSCFGVREADRVRDAMNRDRNANGLWSLPPHSMLDAKAQAHADQLALTGGLYHSKLTDGISGCYRALGENVGYGGSIDDIQRAYMASPGHRANILAWHWTHVGTGIAYRGNIVYTVQVFMQAC